MRTKYQFETEEINHCYDGCPLADYVPTLGINKCMLDKNIECSDIIVPVECPLTRVKE